MTLRTVLASTFHDPEDRLGKLINKNGALIKEIFQLSYVVVTPTTSSKTINALEKLEFSTSKGSKTITDVYRKALKQALLNHSEHIFYCDFDRILHWTSTHLEELQIVNSNLDNDFLLVGRTSRAFKTHPETQTMTEGIANQLASKIQGNQRHYKCMLEVYA